MTLEHSKRKHSEFSASGAYRWMACPGSVRLSRSAPPSVDSKYALEGTAAHECLEFLVRRYANLPKAVAQALKKWPDEMVAHCTVAAAEVYALKPSKTAKLLIETRVVLKQISHRFYGTLDYAWLEDWGTVVVIDFKYGAGVTVAPFGDDGRPNPQLMYYAAGLAHLHDYEFETVRLAIIQPRVWSENGSPTAVGDTSIKAIRSFESEIKAAMAIANRADAPLHAGDHCRWCPAAATCPELSQVSMEEAGIVFDLDQGLAATPEPLALTERNMGKILKACDQLETWTRAVKERAFRMLEDGRKIPGYKLVAKRAQRVWLPDAERKAAIQFGASVYETNPEFLSPAKLEKRFGANAKAFTAEFTSAVSSGFTIVPDSDQRSGIKDVHVFDFET